MNKNIAYIVLGTVILLLIIGKVNRKRKRKNMQIQVDEINCTGCQRCVKRCRHKVLGIKKTGDTVHPFVENRDRCSACGDCIGVCRFKALKFIPNVKTERVVNV